MKKMYAALLAAAMITAGAGLNAQAAEETPVGNYVTVGETGTAGMFQVKGEDGVTAVGIYGADGSVHANGGVSAGSGLRVAGNDDDGFKFIVDDKGGLTATDAHFNGGLYAAEGVSGSSGSFDTLKVAGKDVATQDAVANNESAINTLTGRVTKNESDIGNLKGRVEKNESDIGTLTGRVSKNEGDIGNLKGRVTKNEGDIGTLNGRVDNHDKLIEENATAIQNNSNRINALSDRVSDLGGEIDNVGAISAALAGLHPFDYDGTGSKFQLAAAMGNYDGTQAAAIGGFYHFNEDVMMSVGGATSFGGDNKSAFNVGVSFRVGQGSSGKKVSSDAVLAQLEAMNEKIAALEAENQSLSEKVAALEAPAPAAE